MTFRRRFLQFSLRTMLGTMLVAAVVLGGFQCYWNRQTRIRQQSIQGLEQDLAEYRKIPEAYRSETLLAPIEWRAHKSFTSLPQSDWQRMIDLVEREKEFLKRWREEQRALARITAMRKSWEMHEWLALQPHDPYTACRGWSKFDIFTHPQWGDN